MSRLAVAIGLAFTQVKFGSASASMVTYDPR